ncbi:MAG: DUF2911 domain-containing protein [Terriglobia bacterium]
MKKFALGVLNVLMMACFAAVALAQGNPRGTSSFTINGKTVSVEYGRPSLKGRTTDALLGKLKPGSLWRMGADTSTTFKTDTDLAFGDVTIPAGEYSIWMQRQEDNSWKLLFDKQHGQWGAPAPDASKCFASAALKESKPANSVEMVTLALRRAGNGGTLTIEWGTLEAVASFTAK